MQQAPVLYTETVNNVTNDMNYIIRRTEKRLSYKSTFFAMRITEKNIGQKTPGISKKSADTITSAKLSQLAFDNSAMANIVSATSNGKIIMANLAACKLLGYSKREILTKSRSVIFDIKEHSFKKMLRQRTAEGHSIALVTAIKKTGKPISCEITSAVFMDEDGIEKAVTSIADMSRNILKQKNIDTKKDKKVADNIIQAQIQSADRQTANNEWIKYIAETSYDVMWDWDIVRGEIYVGDSSKEVFGYMVENNTAAFNDFSYCLLPEDRYAVEKKLGKTLASAATSWDDAFMFKRKDGSYASTTSRGCIVRDKQGKAIRLIGAIQDISRLLELEDKLARQIIIHEEDSEKFLLAAKLSFDVIWDWNLLTNEVFLGEGFEELFGYVIKDNKGNMITDWVNYLHPNDKEAVIKELQDNIKSTTTHWENAYRVTRADGSVAKVFVRASIIRHPDGKAYRMIGAMQDLSRQNELEEKLEHEINVKEKQIADATEDAKDTERSDIGKELHDNINQLLGASKMYVEMAKRGGKDSRMYLNRSSEYTLTAIEEIRKLTKGLRSDAIKNLGLCESVKSLTRDIMEVNRVKISCELDGFQEQIVNDKFKLNIFRIIQEELNNILKHAGATEVDIRLSQNNQSITLTIADDGVGFDTTAKRQGIGVANIKDRSATYNGTADFISEPGEGCLLTVTFPVGEVLLNK